MYKPRKNFLSYEVPSAESKKAEAKQILSSMFEALSVDELNSLYQPTEVSKTVATKPVAMDTPAAATKLQPVSDTLITVGKLPMEDDQVVVDVKKPVKVVFRDSTGTNIRENAAVLDDEVVAPSEETSDDESYDFLQSAPPLDLTSDLQNTVLARGQGMMPSVQITPGMALPTSHKGEDIKSVEEDPEGFSVVGLDNDIGMNMLM